MNAPKSPYPWFGGKSRAAEHIWRAFGSVDNYVEPFFGSGVVLLSRPDFDSTKTQIETINDLDSMVANFWRSVKSDPDAVAYWADYPVSEIDMHARHGWLVNRKERLSWCLEDPDFYDAKIAGWWVWGMASWIGGGFCSGAGPWVSDGAHIHDSRQLPGRGNRKRPHLGDAGQGINRQRPHYEYMAQLSERMRNVRVCNGDWTRVLGPSVTLKHGMTGIFLDPPYSEETGRVEVYSHDSGTIAHDVRQWCIENGDNPLLRIVLCGHDGEHDMPQSWQCVQGYATNGGYGGQKRDGSNQNHKRERMWLSPACIKERTLFDMLAEQEIGP